MVMKDRLCVVLWIQQDSEADLVGTDEASERFLNRFDTENVAVFRISSLNLLDRLKSFENRLSGAKFDGRIRLVINVKEPVAVLKQTLSLGYLKHVPVLVNMSCVLESPEDSIFEVGRLKADTQFSTKPSDFDKYCSFATVLWINYKEDPNRTVVEKRISKTGVVIEKTDSVERGLKYMDAHGHLAYLHEFRIIIGDGKLQLDEATEAALNANKKRDFFAARAAQMRRNTIGGNGPRGASRSAEEEFSTLELVQVIRNRQKWHTPVLVFSYDGSLPEPALYTFKNLKTTSELEQLEYFSCMKALPWAVDLSHMLSAAESNTSAPGFLRIVNLRCNHLVPKKSGGSMDPHVVVKVGSGSSTSSSNGSSSNSSSSAHSENHTFEKKTKKMSSTLNPIWNLGWEIPCKLSDRISLLVVDKGMFGKSDFEAEFSGVLSDLIPVATPLVEVTKLLESRLHSGSSSNAGSNASSGNSNSKDSKDSKDSSSEKSASSKSAGNNKEGHVSGNTSSSSHKDKDKDREKESSNSNSVQRYSAATPGTVTVEIGFRFDGQREHTLGKVFGQPFEQTMDETIRDAVPHLTEAAICQLTMKGLECEGIFRQPANQKRVDALRELYDKNGASAAVDLSAEDPHDIAFLLRTYIKELPQPIIPRTKYQAFKACNNVEKRREKLVALSDVLGQLPPHNLEVFANIIHLLADISKHELLNKMTARNLATVLGPALVIPRDVEADPSTYLADTTAVASVLETCILFYHKLFQRGSSAPSNANTSTLESISEGTVANASTSSSKRKSAAATSVAAFIDPYLTDSLSSPRYGSSSSSSKKSSHSRAHSEANESTGSKKRREYLKTDFVLDPKLLHAKQNPIDSESADPYSELPEIGETDSDEESSALDEKTSEADKSDTSSPLKPSPPSAQSSPQPKAVPTYNPDDDEDDEP